MLQPAAEVSRAAFPSGDVLGKICSMVDILQDVMALLAVDRRTYGCRRAIYLIVRRNRRLYSQLLDAFEGACLRGHVIPIKALAFSFGITRKDAAVHNWTCVIHAIQGGEGAVECLVPYVELDMKIAEQVASSRGSSKTASWRLSTETAGAVKFMLEYAQSNHEAPSASPGEASSALVAGGDVASTSSRGAGESPPTYPVGLLAELLVSASERGALVLVQYLLNEQRPRYASHADKEAVAKWTSMAFTHACYCGEVSVVRYLLKEFADVLATDKDLMMSREELFQKTMTACCDATVGSHLDVLLAVDKVVCFTADDIRRYDAGTVEPFEKMIAQACSLGHMAALQWTLAKLTSTEDSQTKTKEKPAAFVGGAQESKDDCALMFAAQHGHLGIVRFLCEDVGLTVDDVVASDALRVAVNGGHHTVVEYFFTVLSLPVDSPACSVNGGETVLQLACRRGHLDIVHFLIEQLKFPATSLSGECPFFGTLVGLALYGGSVPTLQYVWSLQPLRELFTRLFPSNTFSLEFQATMRLLAADGRSDMLRHIVILFGLDADTVRFDSDCLLHQAVQYGHVDVVRWFVTQYRLIAKDVCSSDNVNHFSLLETAILLGHDDIVRYLFDHYHLYRCPECRLARCCALHFGFHLALALQLTRLLINDSCNDGCKHSDGDCGCDKDDIRIGAWQQVIASGSIQMIKFVAKQFRKSLPDVSMASEVAKRGSVAVANLVLSWPGAGKNTRAEDVALMRSDDNFALSRAAESGFHALLLFLAERYGLTAEDARSRNHEALRFAVREGQDESVRCLFEEYGLTLDDARANDNYALVNAAHRDSIPMVKYLIETVGLTLEDVARNNYQAVRVAYSAGSGSGHVVHYLASHFGLDLDGLNLDHTIPVHDLVQNLLHLSQNEGDFWKRWRWVYY